MIVQGKRLSESDYLFNRQHCAEFTSSEEDGDVGRLPLLSAVGVS